jgi:predicted MFS family arabinose efflux permease
MSEQSGRHDDEYSNAYRSFVLFMLTVVYAFNFIDRQILVILQEPIKADMGLSDAQLGLLTGFSFALVYVTAGIPIAYWADRGNRRNIVSLALAVWSGMTAISGFVQNYLQLLLARLGVGIGEAGGSPPAHSMISDYYPPERRGTALSIYSTGIYIGILVGFALGGIIADSFGWRTAFLVVGIPGVLFAVVLRFTVKEPTRGRWESAEVAASKPSIRETLDLLKRRPSFWFIAFGCAMTAYVSYGNGNFMPSYLIRSHGMTVAQVGVVLALVVGVSGVAGTFLGGFLSDRLGVEDKRWYLWVPLLGMVCGIIPFFYVLLSNHTPSVLGTLVFVNIATTLYLGPCIAISHALVPPAMRAVTSAILFFILNIIGLGLGPLLTGVFSDLLKSVYGDQSLRYAMVATAIMGFVAMLMFFLGARRLPADLIKARARD